MAADICGANPEPKMSALAIIRLSKIRVSRRGRRAVNINYARLLCYARYQTTARPARNLINIENVQRESYEGITSLSFRSTSSGGVSQMPCWQNQRRIKLVISSMSVNPRRRPAIAKYHGIKAAGNLPRRMIVVYNEKNDGFADDGF